MHNFKTMISNTTFGKEEFLLAACSVIIVVLIADAVLLRVLPSAYAPTRYGWTASPAMSRTVTIEDSPGEFREVSITYADNGFKRWGDVHTSKMKMLIIGDSMTEMPFVSNGEEWYAYLEKAFADLELFVYGGSGYGSLQEFLVLNDFIDTVKPQVIVIQFYGNDFEDNLYDLDVNHYPLGNHGTRPYWEDGRTVYRLPAPFEKIRQHSFLADRLLVVYDNFQRDKAKKDLPAYFRQKFEKEKAMSKTARQRKEELHRKAVAVTKNIYALIRQRAGGIPIYILNVNDDPLVEEICRECQCHCIAGISRELALKEQQGTGDHDRVR